MARPTFRVHLVTHHDGRRTGRLLPSSGEVDSPLEGYGETDEHVMAQLALGLAENPQEVPGYLWDVTLEVRSVKVSVHPQSIVKRRHVIGKEEITLQVTYVAAKQEGGGWRVLVPRFRWWFMLETLSMAAVVIKQAVSSALLGEDGRSLYAFRTVADERVVEWSPPMPRDYCRPRRRPESNAMPTLHAVAQELVALSKKKRSRPLVGNVDLERWLPMVTQEHPRSLLIVGPPGVGKSTWVRVLARRLASVSAEGSNPFVPRIWSTSAERIVAGMAYLGQWEQRCLDLVAELSGEGDLLHVGDLAGFIRARSGRTSIADMLMPAVLDGEISLLCECDPATLERLSSQFPALLGHFVTVRIEEPSASVMPHWLDEYQTRVMKGLRIGPEGLRRLVRYLDLFQRDAGFPGKGIRFIDWLAAEQGAAVVGGGASSESSDGQPPPVVMMSADAVAEAFARATGLPLQIISDAQAAGLDSITAKLEAGVVGQTEACRVAARVITRLKVGLDDPERPVGSLFFVGPTGVGKTELAKQLARYLFGDASRMIRLDMSEYMMPGSSQRMLAVGRGVSSLVEQVRQSPLSLVLLDEIEKAHPEVFDLLLAMLGEGRMTDIDGHRVDFTMTIIVMTSNLGVRRAGSTGFSGDTEDPRIGLVSEVRKHFRPEFFNRIDHVVPFRALTPDDILAVVDLELAKAARRGGFVRRGLRLQATSEAKAKLARMGFHPTRGARPLRRVIEERIIGPLAVRLAADPKLRDSIVHVVVEAEPDLAAAGSRGGIVLAL